MKKITSTLLIILFTTNLLSDEINPNDLSEDELMQQIMQMQQRSDSATKRIEEARAKTEKEQKKSEEIRQEGKRVDQLEKDVDELGKTVNELANKLGVKQLQKNIKKVC